MNKLLFFTFTCLPLFALGQDLPRYDDPQQSPQDPDVWHITRASAGRRFISVYYHSLSEIIEANAQQADQQQLSAEAKRAKLRHDSTEYAGGIVFISANCTDRNTIDGSLTVVVLDSSKSEVLRRTLPADEAELSVSSRDFARIYAVPVAKPLPANSFVIVADNPALQHHEFMLRPIDRHPAAGKN